MLKRLLIAPLLAAAISLAACSDSGNESNAETAGETAGDETSQFAEFADGPAPKPAIPDQIATKFGKSEALKAWDIASTFVLTQQFNDKNLQVTRDNVSVDSFPIEEALSEDLYPKIVKRIKCADTDKTCYQVVASLIFFGGDDAPLAIRDPKTGDVYEADVRTDVEQAVFDKQIVEASASIDDEGRPSFTFETKGDIRVRATNSVDYIQGFGTVVTVGMVKDGGSWRIDSFSNRFLRDKPARYDH